MRQKGHGVTHFAELHRVPHKASLSGVAKGDALFSLQLICITFLLSLQHPFWYLLLHLHLFPLSLLLPEHYELL